MEIETLHLNGAGAVVHEDEELCNETHSEEDVLADQDWVHMTVEGQSRQRVLAVCDWIVDRLERHAGGTVALVLLLIFVIALGQSANKLLWFDELITLKTAFLPHWSDVWNFYNNGLDTTGPVPSMIARVGLLLPTSPELVSRLPFTFAYLVMCFSMYSFVHRRYPAVYALAAPIFSLNYAFFSYATEARAYALVLAGCGIAMLSWQSAVSGLHRRWSVFGIWLGLAFAIEAHAFAIFLLAPFAVAQLTRDLKRKEADLAVWMALTLSPAGLLPVLHGELLAKKIYGTNFWSQPNFESLFKSYSEFVSGGSSYLKILLFVAIGAALLHWRSRSQSKMRGFSTPEWILVSMLVLLPAFSVLASYPLHVYVARYAVGCNIGMVVLSIALVAEAARRSRYSGAVLLVLFLFAAAHSRFGEFVQGLHALVHPGRVHENLQVRYNNLEWVKLLERSSLPVVTDNISLDSQFEFYASSKLQQRLYGVTDIEDISKYPRTTTFQLNLVYFGGRILRQTQDIADFLPEHPHFLQMAEPSEIGWLLPYLAAQQAAGSASSVCLGPANCTGRTGVYEVQFTKIPVLAESK
ncbi:MAG: hypothetical protein ABR923_16830 [Terracidiphilus sp.]